MPLASIHDVLSLWWIGLIAFGVSLVATPVARYVAYRTKIVDRPDDLLKPHGRPIAYLGGVAMYVGLLAGLLAYLAFMPQLGQDWSELVGALKAHDIPTIIQNPIWNLGSILLACGLMTMMGLMDDIKGLKPRQKIYWQTGAALLLVAGGVADKMAKVFLIVIPPGYMPMWLIVPVSAIMCVLFVVSTCNATNLLDGLDGLCGGVTGIIAIGFLGLAIWLEMWVEGRASHATLEHFSVIRIALCLAMVGAILGFLPYNVPPASIFMGDAGSMLLGFFVATMMALFCLEGQEGGANSLVAAIVVYALPIADTGLAVVRRLLSGKSIFAGDRSHLYDQLVDRGMTVKHVVILFYVLAGLAAVVGIVQTIFFRGRWALVIDVALAVVVWIIFIKKGMLKPPPHDASKKIHD